MTDYTDLVARLRVQHGNKHALEAAAALEAQTRRIAELETALKDATVCLVAAISLLERGGKKAAPSNKMFEQMLVDYKNGVERARAALEKKNDSI